MSASQDGVTIPAAGNQAPLDLAGRHVHFTGIGGSGMSGLARLVRQRGAVCTGSDRGPSPAIEALRTDGFTVSLEQTAESLPDACEIIVASAAIGADHPELLEAQRRGARILKYAQMLGELMRGRVGVAIAGTHGKSTTTSILSHILLQAGLDPSFIIGANCRQIGGGARSGGTSGGTSGDTSGGILVAEACEYDRSFHNFHPTHAVILNVEEDHLDYYGSLEAIIESFAVFARKLPPLRREAQHSASPAGGSLLIQHEMPHRLAITAELDCAVETVGFAYQADWRVGIKDGRVRLHHRGEAEAVAQWRSPMPGEHMAYNAAAAAITAHRLGASWKAVTAAVESFQGLDRRMQLLGQLVPGQPGVAAKPVLIPKAITVVDDYGHHPTEIDTTLRALRRHYQPTRLICVFQPHQHSRTRFLMQQFAASFTEADLVIVPHIYFVRDSEQERQAVTAGDLVDRLRQKGVQAMHLYPFAAIVEQLQAIARPGDLIVTMGAGDVWQVARDLLG